MSSKPKNNRTNSDSPGLISRLLSLMLKQIIAAAICLAIIIGMNSSSNLQLKNCAKAFSRAICFNPKWEEGVKEAFSSLKNISDYKLPSEIK